MKSVPFSLTFKNGASSTVLLSFYLCVWSENALNSPTFFFSPFFLLFSFAKLLRTQGGVLFSSFSFLASKTASSFSFLSRWCDTAVACLVSSWQTDGLASCLKSQLVYDVVLYVCAHVYLRDCILFFVCLSRLIRNVEVWNDGGEMRWN